MIDGDRIANGIETTPPRIASFQPRDVEAESEATMEITFIEKLLHWKGRDAERVYVVDVIDGATPYPVRIMIDGPELLRSGYEIPELNEDIVKAFYRQELEALVRSDRLKPENPARTVNVVLCVNDRREGVQDGDVVVDGMYAKIRAIAAGRGKPTA
jgi:hypothetical protein